MVEVIINWCNIPEMQANIARLFACCASAPDNDPPGSEDESPEVKMSGVPAVHGVLAGLRAVTKMNDMPLSPAEQKALTPRISFDTDSMSRRTDDEYDELVAEGSRCASREDWHRAARAFREAIALRPDEPVAYLNLGTILANSGHHVEAAQRYLEAKERYPVGSEDWAAATAAAFEMLRLPECAEAAKPEWWNDEGLKALSARVVRAAPNDGPANNMRAQVLSGRGGAWEAGPRSAAELKEAAAHYDRAVAIDPAPAVKADLASLARWCRTKSAEAL